MVLPADESRPTPQELEAYLGRLEHGLRGSLAPIGGVVTLLQSGTATPHKVSWAIDVIASQLAHLEWLVDELHDRHIPGNIELTLTPVSLDEVVNGAVDACRYFFDQSARDLAISLPPEAALLHADRRWLTRALALLLRHAIAATPPHRTIRLSATVRNGQARVVLQYWNPGRTPTSPEANSFPGGLAPLELASHLVVLHYGRLERTTQKGESSFSLWLPLAEDGRGTVHGHPSHYRILVVDDVDDTADSLALGLQSAGHRTWIAHDGAGAIKLALEVQPEVVLLDLGLPDQDGYSVCSALRQQGLGRKTLIVAVTGWGQTEARLRSSAVGFDAHLVKPVYPRDLIQLISNHWRITAT